MFRPKSECDVSRPLHLSNTMQVHRSHTRLIGLIAATVVAFALALLGPPAGDGPLGALGVDAAAAAQCRGGSLAPKRLNSKRARRIVRCLVNKERRKHGAGPVKAVPNLRESASRHNRRMVKRRCFSHSCPGEPSLPGRLERSNYLPCNCAWGAGETLAYGKGSKGSPRSIVKAWMASPPHRQNLLSRSFEHVGLGWVHGTPSGHGKKNRATYTLNFGYKR